MHTYQTLPPNLSLHTLHARRQTQAVRQTHTTSATLHAHCIHKQMKNSLYHTQTQSSQRIIQIYPCRDCPQGMVVRACLLISLPDWPYTLFVCRHLYLFIGVRRAIKFDMKLPDVNYGESIFCFFSASFGTMETWTRAIQVTYSPH